MDSYATTRALRMSTPNRGSIDSGPNGARALLFPNSSHAEPSSVGHADAAAQRACVTQRVHNSVPAVNFKSAVAAMQCSRPTDQSHPRRRAHSGTGTSMSKACCQVFNCRPNRVRSTPTTFSTHKLPATPAASTQRRFGCAEYTGPGIDSDPHSCKLAYDDVNKVMYVTVTHHFRWDPVPPLAPRSKITGANSAWFYIDFTQ